MGEEGEGKCKREKKELWRGRESGGERIDGEWEKGYESVVSGGGWVRERERRGHLL